TGVALPWNPDPALFEMPELPSTAAYALASAPRGILAGGGFRSFRGAHRRGLAVVDPATGAVAPWNAWVNGPVWALTRSHGRTYALGGFTRIRGGSRPRAAALGPRPH